jgi:hypothetical protein
MFINENVHELLKTILNLKNTSQYNESTLLLSEEFFKNTLFCHEYICSMDLTIGIKNKCVICCDLKKLRSIHSLSCNNENCIVFNCHENKLGIQKLKMYEMGLNDIYKYI